MSGQAKRSRVRTAERHRRQVARLIALSHFAHQPASNRTRPPTALRVFTSTVADGERFDVALARAYGEQLVREGTAALETWVVYCDWLRGTWLPGDSQGWAFDFAARTAGMRREWAQGPGRQREAGIPAGCGPVHVSDDPGDGRGELFVIDGPDGEQTEWHDNRDDAIAEANRRWAQLVPGKRPRMDGAALVRMGARLLAALEGQPSECRGCSGGGHYVDMADGHEFECLNCRGTGHNLAGVLAPVDWPAVVVRHVTDAERHRRRENPEGWTDDIADALGLADPSLQDETRTAPRGEHRTLESADMAAAIHRCTRRQNVTGESIMLWRTRTHRADMRAPRWWYADQPQIADVLARGAAQAAV